MNEVKSPKKPLLYYYFVAMLLVMLFNFIAMPWISEHQIKDVDYNTFVTMTEQGEVGRVEIQEQSNRILFTSSDEKTVYKTAMVPDDGLVQRLLDAGVSTTGEEIEQTSLLVSILAWVLPIIIFVALGQYVSRKMMEKMGGGGNSMMFNMGKSNAKVYVKSAEGIKFSDVAGEDEAKENLTEIVNYLHDPAKYQDIGASMPKGILLVGPPGTGKTMLAKAVAGEANVPFFSMSGSEFVEMFVGVGASRVRDLFRKANNMAPCIIFIDEIDAIGGKRDTRHGGGDSEREQTLNQLLSEMDGFDSSKGIIVLAATNRPEVLDKALLRPGRFDRRIIVSKPDMQGRIDTLKVHSKNVKMDETVDFKELALATSGAVGADLANIINEAALMAVRNKRDYVSQKDLIASVEVVFAGKEKKEKLLSPREKKIVAYHEVGHALVAALQKNTLPIQRITIVPRTSGALGYVWQVPEEEKQLQTKKEMEEDIVTFLAGRAAEELKFDSVTNGASNDIEKATSLARTMITMYGMSEKFGMVQLEGVTGEYLDNRRVLNCSSETETKVDTEVKNMMKASYEKAYKLLKKNMPTLDAIAQVLYEKENLSGKEFMELYEKYQNVKLTEAEKVQ